MTVLRDGSKLYNCHQLTYITPMSDSHDLIKNLGNLTPTKAVPLKKVRTDSLLSQGIDRREVLNLASELFGTEAAAAEWMSNKILTLGNKTPASLMRSRKGCQIVVAELGRIAYGAPA